MKEEAKNCRNCGAPLNELGDCEYCGTKSQVKTGSYIELTADHIYMGVIDREIMQAAERHRKAVGYTN